MTGAWELRTEHATHTNDAGSQARPRLPDGGDPARAIVVALSAVHDALNANTAALRRRRLDARAGRSLLADGWEPFQVFPVPTYAAGHVDQVVPRVDGQRVLGGHDLPA